MVFALLAIYTCLLVFLDDNLSFETIWIWDVCLLDVKSVSGLWCQNMDAQQNNYINNFNYIVILAIANQDLFIGLKIHLIYK